MPPLRSGERGYARNRDLKILMFLATDRKSTYAKESNEFPD